MSNRMETGYDIVAELLKKLKVKPKVSSDELERATKRYNEMVTELNNYKKTKGQKSHGQMQVSDKEQSGSSKAIEKQKSEIESLKEENISLKRQVDELRNRLSQLAGQRLTDGNPDIADLSDPYRPTNIAEKFKQLYDDEWTHAYEVLDKTSEVDEKTILDFLANIVKEVDQFCTKVSNSQRSKIQHYMMDDLVSPKVELPDGKGTVVASKKAAVDKRREELAFRLLTDFRKSLGTLSVEPLVEIFESSCMPQLKKVLKIPVSTEGINSYAAKCIQLVWMMKVQHPPMEFEWTKADDICDKNKFTFYTKRGERVKHTVWPAVLLHKDGPLVSKGVVQAV